MSLFKVRRDVGALEASYFAPFFDPRPTPFAPRLLWASFAALPRVGVPVDLVLQVEAEPAATLAYEWRVDGAAVSEAAAYTPVDAGALLECRITATNLIDEASLTAGPALILAAGNFALPRTLPFRLEFA